MPPDVFVSYRRKENEYVLPLVQALRAEGVLPWVDQSEIDDFAPITYGIRKGLAQSKMLIAWYSADYPKSRPCQMELTAAFLAAQREGDPRRRVLVINPEGAPTHIEPIELRDAQYAGAPVNAAGYAALAKRIKAHLATLAEPLGAILPIAPPSQYGLKLAGASRFVGRLPELWRIHSALHASESAIISSTSGAGLAQVSGLGGIGKSLLAEEYALRFGAAYPGGIFWLRAFGNDPTRSAARAEAREAVRVEQFAAVATAMGIEVKGLKPAQVEALLGAKLTQTGKPFLWIVDDLGSGLGDAIRAWLAPSPLGKTLVTTRSREYGAIGTSLPLGVLSPQEAFELLCARRKPVGLDETSAAHGIAADLGYHALAVDVTGAALDKQAGLVSFKQFRENLANPARDELDLAAELADMLPSGHEKSVAATLLRSVRSLPEEGQDFLRLASLLAVAPIPPALVAATFGRVDGLEESVARRRAVAALAAVEKASLAERTEGDARLVHTLVSRTMRFRDALPERTAALRAKVVTSLEKALVGVSDIRTHQRLAAEVQHAGALCARGVSSVEETRLANLVALHDCERGLYARSRALLEEALRIRRQLLGEVHPDTLASVNNLAVTLQAEGNLVGARVLQEHAFSVVRRLLGEEHPATLTTLGNLAMTLSKLGDLGHARALQERVLAAHRRVLGEEHPGTLTSMNNLASTRLEQGDLAGAKELWEQVLTISRQVLGEEHPKTISAMNNLFVALRKQGNLHEASVLREKVLSIMRRTFGEEHPDTLTATFNLAESLRTQGDLAGARTLEERALLIMRRIRGEEHPVTLTAKANLAETLRAQGNLVGSRTLQEEVLSIRRRALGEKHPDTLTAMNNLAGTMKAQGDLAGARVLQEEAVSIYRRVLGEKHPDTLTAMRNLDAYALAQGGSTDTGSGPTSP
jgi:Tetratricopeptide repeat/TIR domain